MARIALRAYNREVENLIERGQIEEAIAHCKNILRQFPKHIETYRLLGKAFLESQRYTEAADILQRVLSVIPDDFVSQLGVSIIREDEGNLDASIWHMERAYEVQPFNRAVQDELRRLYGRRDGAEPPRVRLTRGALVRMYARGDLYPQAIAEIRAALAEDHNRIDLLVLLARMYYQSGQKLEATEICSSLIGKLPFCIEANRILMEVLPETSHAEDARVFQQRVYSLDPYAAFLSPNAPTSQQVPDQTVMVEHVDWQPTEQETQSPDWARTIGVQWEDTKEEALPDWLNDIHTPAAPSAPTAIQTPVSSEPPQPQTLEPDATPEYETFQEDLLPDFLKGAGWAPSDGTVEETPVQYDDDILAPASDTLAEAEIPDWLQSMAPDQSAQSTPEPIENENLDWLSGILPPAAAAAAETSENPAPLDVNEAPVEAAPAEEMPDWLKELKSESPEASSLSSLEISSEAQSPAEASSQVEQPTFDPGLLPAWLRGEDPIIDQTVAPVEAAPTEEETTFPWLDSPAAVDAGRLTESASDDFPWLADQTKPLTTAARPQIEDEMTHPSSTLTPDIASEEMTPASEQEVETTSSQPLDQSAGGSVTEIPAGMDTAAAIPSQPAETTQPEPDDMDSALAWLESLAARQGADADSLKISSPEDRTETPPDWIAAQAQAPITEPEETAQPSADVVPDAEPQAPLQDLPGWLSEPAQNSLETPAVEAAEIPAWLQISQPEEITQPIAIKEDTVEAPVVAEETLQAPSNPPEKVPAASEVNPSEVPEDMDSAMAWLEGLAARQGADADSLKISAPEDRTETPPDWVNQAPIEVPVQEAEVIPQASALEETGSAVPTSNVEEPEAIQTLSEEQPISMESNLVETAISATTEAATSEPDAPLTEISPVDEAVQTNEPIEPISARVVDETIEPIVPNPSPKEMNSDDAFAWLESLAARQGAEEETLITPPEERIEIAEPTQQEPVVENQVQAPVDSAAAEPVSTVQKSAEAVEEPAAVEELKEFKAQIESAAPEKTETADVEIPDWLRSYEEDQQQQPPVWDPTVQSLKTDSVPDEVIPNWMNEESQPVVPISVPLASTSQAPVAPADELEAWLEGLDNQPAAPSQNNSSAEPETGFEWLPEQETLPVENNPAVEPPVTQQPVQAAAAVSGAPLENARTALASGNLETAVELYNQLINSDSFLSETIQDLHAALTQHSNDANLWLTYGDACIRGNKVQDALEAYTNAENLLR